MMPGLLPQIPVKALPKQKVALWWARSMAASARSSMSMLIPLQCQLRVKAPSRLTMPDVRMRNAAQSPQATVIRAARQFCYD